MKSNILEHMQHAYLQIDGTYTWPNSREGDMLRRAQQEITSFQLTIDLLTLALKEAMEWNWLDDDMPSRTVDYCQSILDVVQNDDTTCPHCSIEMTVGLVLVEGVSARVPDFPGDDSDSPGQTLSPSGQSTLTVCWKCPGCGHSTLKGKKDA